MSSYLLRVLTKMANSIGGDVQADPNFLEDVVVTLTLDQARREALKDHAPEWLVAIVDGFTPEDRYLIYQAIGPGDRHNVDLAYASSRDGRKHFVNYITSPEDRRIQSLYTPLQRAWKEDALHYLGEHLGRPPTLDEQTDESMKEDARYKLCWLGLNPECVVIRGLATPKGLDLATDFLSKVRTAKIRIELAKTQNLALAA